MGSAVETTVKAFGALAGLAGLEHGVGEALQGSVRPAGPVIQSWPDAAFFASLNGEPAMTLVPNLLLSGILSILVALALMVWTLRYVAGPRGPLGLLLLSILLLLVGGGFGPPLLGIILAAAATAIGGSLSVWRRILPEGLREALGASWPWMIGAGLVAWLAVSPGVGLLGYVGVDDATLITGIIAAAFILLFLAIVTAVLRDAQSRAQPEVARR